MSLGLASSADDGRQSATCNYSDKPDRRMSRQSDIDDLKRRTAGIERRLEAMERIVRDASRPLERFGGNKKLDSPRSTSPGSDDVDQLDSGDVLPGVLPREEPKVGINSQTRAVPIYPWSLFRLSSPAEQFNMKLWHALHMAMGEDLLHAISNMPAKDPLVRSAIIMLVNDHEHDDDILIPFLNLVEKHRPKPCLPADVDDAYECFADGDEQTGVPPPPSEETLSARAGHTRELGQKDGERKSCDVTLRQHPSRPPTSQPPYTPDQQDHGRVASPLVPLASGPLIRPGTTRPLPSTQPKVENVKMEARTTLTAAHTLPTVTEVKMETQSASAHSNPTKQKAAIPPGEIAVGTSPAIVTLHSSEPSAARHDTVGPFYARHLVRPERAQPMVSSRTMDDGADSETYPVFVTRPFGDEMKQRGVSIDLAWNVDEDENSTDTEEQIVEQACAVFICNGAERDAD
ncbi:hypothetical protein AURDEDRAFT_131343 [Auricularia subglabra TFB-10046 SS5]|uniref:Uncharacterized protein n=1 Tax=Auricularia subglabra (strain TFB-10046 / SS5) TaxID=717982 RepID=J0WQE3_AURST|nr:hypothetical protein AURDEDRAFT_131343 [Auricularia subglabra TFB-10046 SS5]